MDKKKKNKVAGNPDEVLEKLQSGENPAISLISAFRGKLPDIFGLKAKTNSVFYESKIDEIQVADIPSREEFEELEELMEEKSL